MKADTTSTNSVPQDREAHAMIIYLPCHEKDNELYLELFS